MKKLFKNGTIYIADGEMLEQVKERFFKLGFPVLWGFVQEDYKDDKAVSSGYLHYDTKMFYLSKSDYGKPIMSLEHFNELEIAPKKEKAEKCFSKKDLKKAMEYGVDFGYHQGFTDATNDNKYAKKPFKKSVFRDYLVDNF